MPTRGPIRVGNRVIITNAKRYLSTGSLTPYGQVVKIDFTHYEGGHLRPFAIMFNSVTRFNDSGSTSWFSRDEIKRLTYGDI